MPGCGIAKSCNLIPSCLQGMYSVFGFAIFDYTFMIFERLPRLIIYIAPATASRILIANGIAIIIARDRNTFNISSIIIFSNINTILKKSKGEYMYSIKSKPLRLMILDPSINYRFGLTLSPTIFQPRHYIGTVYIKSISAL